jgi:hypothetical protein
MSRAVTASSTERGAKAGPGTLGIHGSCIGMIMTFIIDLVKPLFAFVSAEIGSFDWQN